MALLVRSSRAVRRMQSGHKALEAKLERERATHQAALATVKGENEEMRALTKEYAISLAISSAITAHASPPYHRRVSLCMPQTAHRCPLRLTLRTVCVP